MFTAGQFEDAARLVHQTAGNTAQIHWPTLSQRAGAEVWVKHENHNPTGAFKVRGGITFIDWLTRTRPESPGIVTATRGNHGQSQARAATAAGLRAVIYVPRGNSVEKNAAMRAYGGTVIEFGADFDEAREEVFRVADAEGLTFVPPFHPELVRGVATYAWELLTALPDLDTLFVPIGCGSGIVGCISARDALRHPVKIVAVVARGAETARLSAEAGRMIETNAAQTFADGMAVRVPVQDALDIYKAGADRFVTVTDDEIAEAIRIYYADTHNLAEGAGAAPLAALLQERDRIRGRKVATVLCGGNIDRTWFQAILSGQTPSP